MEVAPKQLTSGVRMLGLMMDSDEDEGTYYDDASVDLDNEDTVDEDDEGDDYELEADDLELVNEARGASDSDDIPMLYTGPGKSKRIVKSSDYETVYPGTVQSDPYCHDDPLPELDSNGDYACVSHNGKLYRGIAYRGTEKQMGIVTRLLSQNEERSALKHLIPKARLTVHLAQQSLLDFSKRKLDEHADVFSEGIIFSTDLAKAIISRSKKREEASKADAKAKAKKPAEEEQPKASHKKQKRPAAPSQSAPAQKKPKTVAKAAESSAAAPKPGKWAHRVQITLHGKVHVLQPGESMTVIAI